MCKFNLFILPIFLFCITQHSKADDTFCQNSTEYKTQATASTWENLRNNRGSLKYETGNIIKQSLPTLDSQKQLVIVTTPKLLDSDSGDKEYCDKKFTKTENEPLVYNPKDFASLEDLNKWIGDFSQGNGKEGTDLYAKCDKSCSPQYTYYIKKKSGEAISLKSSVVCGPARDKDDNNYLIKARCE